MSISQPELRLLPELLEKMAQLDQRGLLLTNPLGNVEYATSNVPFILRAKQFSLPGVSLQGMFGLPLAQKLLSAEREDWVIVEHSLPDPEQEALTLQVSSLPYKDNLDRTGGFLVSLFPVEGMESRERFTSMGELAASIAHEIRNPLAAILTTAETMREDFDARDSRREYLERIISEINRVNLFLVKFLALARPQKPQVSLAYMSEVLDNVLHLECREIEKRGIKVLREYEPHLPKSHFDPHQMHQVFLNLILNALQAMSNGGALRVAVRQEKNGGGIRVEIGDNGSGIRPQDLKNIFAPFFSTKPKGVGLGLSVSQQIVKKHNGQMQVKSRYGEGTLFVITLPLRQ